VANDHEGMSLDDVLIRVRNGVYAHLRHNLLVPTLPELIKGITEMGGTSITWCGWRSRWGSTS